MIQSAPILLGQYRPLDSFLHRLDARAKLVPVLLVMVLALLTSSLVFYAVLLAALLVGLLTSGIGARTVARNFKPIFILVSITFLYHVIFSERQSEPVWDIFGFAVTRGGLLQAAFFSLRLLLFVAVAFLVTLTNSPSELAESLTKLLRPLEKIGLPIGDLALILFIAIRFIPILFEEFTAIRNAQLIRGVTFSGSFPARIRKMAAIVVPVLVGAIARADELALAMEARGYRSGRPRTFFSRATLDRNAWLFMTTCGLAIGLLFYVTG